MRLLLYNPNIDEQLTGRLARSLAPFIGPAGRLKSATARQGPPFIGSEATIAAARELLLECLEPLAAGRDVILLGCFGDLGLDAIRLRLAVPIVSLSDVCFALAPFLGPTAIVTTSAFWATRLEGEVLRRGLASAIVAVRAIDGITPFSSERTIAECRRQIAQIAADRVARSIVLGGALLAGLRDELSHDSPLPIVDLLGAAAGLCRTLAAAGA